MARQAREAIAEADVIIFVADARAGLTPQDKRIAGELREGARPRLARREQGRRNATRRSRPRSSTSSRWASRTAISAEHGEGVRGLIDAVLAAFPEEPSARPKSEGDQPRVAIVGRPNVGKSTLVNRLLGEERMIAFDQPGTTRDAIEVALDATAGATRSSTPPASRKRARCSSRWRSSRW